MPRDLLKVRIETIPEVGLDLKFGPKNERFAAILGEVAEGKGPREGSANVRLEAWTQRVDVISTVKVQVPQVCALCLEPFSHSWDHSFTQYLMRTSAEDPDEAKDAEIELSLRDLDRSALAGEEIDLGSILREELLLSMPGKPMCRPDCKGICAGCGAELNSEPCTCEAEIDPRWDALKDLKFD